MGKGEIAHNECFAPLVGELSNIFLKTENCCLQFIFQFGRVYNFFQGRQNSPLFGKGGFFYNLAVKEFNILAQSYYRDFYIAAENRHHVLDSKSNWLTAWSLTPFSTVFHLYGGGHCTYPCFLGELLTSTLHNIIFKPLAVFPHNHCQNNGQRCESSGSCHNDYHQSSEKILVEPGIEPATSCSHVLYGVANKEIVST